MPRGAQPHQEVDGDGVDHGDGEEVGEEHEGVGDYVGGEPVDAAGGFAEEDGAFVQEDWECFGGG